MLYNKKVVIVMIKRRTLWHPQKRNRFLEDDKKLSTLTRRFAASHKEPTLIKKAELPDCPVATTVQLIGSKWKLLIIKNLLERTWRFNELQRALRGISQKVLTASLREMERDGIVTRTEFFEVPPHVEYSLSPLGKTLKPILDAMREWGEAYKKAMEV